MSYLFSFLNEIRKREFHRLKRKESCSWKAYILLSCFINKNIFSGILCIYYKKNSQVSGDAGKRGSQNVHEPHTMSSVVIFCHSLYLNKQIWQQNETKL